jgi:hypothetical protein
MKPLEGGFRRSIARFNTLLPPAHFRAFYPDGSGDIRSGGISSPDELSNRAITAGLEIRECRVNIP